MKQVEDIAALEFHHRQGGQCDGLPHKNLVLVSHEVCVPSCLLSWMAKISAPHIIQRFDGFDTRKTKKDWHGGGLPSFPPSGTIMSAESTAKRFIRAA